MSEAQTELLRIGQVSDHSQLPVKTIRFYEERGLIQTAKRSEEHTSELQSPCNLVCRLLLEKKKTKNKQKMNKMHQCNNNQKQLQATTKHHPHYTQI